MQKFLIIGLGNHFPKYKNTRHNIGIDFVKKFGDSFTKDEWIMKQKYMMKNIRGRKNELILICPNSFMNTTGEVLSNFKNQEKLKVLVVQDELDLEIGCSKLSDGSKSTHKGVISVAKVLNISARFRIGIGRNGKIDINKFVIGKLGFFTRMKYKPVYKRFVKSLRVLMEKNINEAKPYFSGRR